MYDVNETGDVGSKVRWVMTRGGERGKDKCQGFPSLFPREKNIVLQRVGGCLFGLFDDVRLFLFIFARKQKERLCVGPSLSLSPTCDTAYLRASGTSPRPCDDESEGDTTSSAGHSACCWEGVEKVKSSVGGAKKKKKTRKKRWRLCISFCFFFLLDDDAMGLARSFVSPHINLPAPLSPHSLTSE